ncbi:MAG: ATP-binding cassette domain-containing protein, partial [Candidatus Thiodiazotropha sp. (ex Notomyrtea botanica)]|nr:ATP-binding cassette domain-containing protein [Candidatus Thiodiazotropha sp. (ex Notomyrtea botanica)]
RVGVMQQGKLVEVGETDQIIHRPGHTYTQALIAALPENLARTEKHEVIEGESPLIRLRQLEIHFPVRKGLFHRVADYVRAVDGVDLDITRGQILAVVGESGSGKTTLGRGILRLTEPTGGQVDFDGTDITNLKRSQLRQFRRNMQIIFQDPISSLNPRLSIAGIITEPMKVHGIGENQEERLEIARDLLEQVQMEEDTLWRYPHEFSGGQRQRIGIARALSLDPSFIVCDEITSALDVSVQAEILRMLLELRRQRGLTLLFITHNIGVVEYVSDQTAVMYQGQIIEQGRTEDIVNRPAHAYTKQLIAAVPRVPV